MILIGASVLIHDIVILLEVYSVTWFASVTSINANASGVVSGGGAGVVILYTASIDPILRVELVVIELELEEVCLI